MPAIAYQTHCAATIPIEFGRSKERQLLSHLDFTAERSHYLVNRPLRSFQSGGREYALPRYLWRGPQGGGDTLRIGIFAGLHGNETEGALAITRLISELSRQPELSKEFALYLYPLCNPTGFEDGTAKSREGRLLSKEFWKSSSAPEIESLESEIWMQAFHGIVNLRSDSELSGIRGEASGAVLSECLLNPALQAASAYLPRANAAPESASIIYKKASNGALRAVRGLTPPPFEIQLTTPSQSRLDLQVEALTAALQSILTEFRGVQAIGANI